MNKYFLILNLTILIYSCQSSDNSGKSRLELIRQESNYKFSEAINIFSKYRKGINTDSLTTVYKKILSEDTEKGYDYATDLCNISKPIKDSIYKISKAIKDSIALIKQAEINKQFAERQKEWYKTKPGKIHKKHPEWTREECQNLADRKIWIGMSLDMLKYLRGNPNRANPSNYGNGVNWQWCWDDYTPSCFYGGENGFITSYN